VYAEARGLLEEGSFAAAEHALQQAAERGERSDRLRSLRAQAVLEIPSPIALASAGRLTDFDFQIGGIAARSAVPAEAQRKREAAYKLLDETESAELEVRLNLGHVLLLLDRPDDALAEFQDLTARHPDEPLAWLGKGIAHFMAEDYEAAESAFQACLERDEQNTAAKINLAITLEEQGELEEALSLWESLPEDSLSEAERQSIAAEIEELRKHLNP
jgi:tetratricopeptide (TPR) repeat protein